MLERGKTYVLAKGFEDGRALIEEHPGTDDERDHHRRDPDGFVKGEKSHWIEHR
jgi:hypothetical protein